MAIWVFFSKKLDLPASQTPSFFGLNLKGKAWLSSQESRFGDGQQHHHHDDDDDDDDDEDEDEDEEEEDDGGGDEAGFHPLLWLIVIVIYCIFPIYVLMFAGEVPILDYG